MGQHTDLAAAAQERDVSEEALRDAFPLAPNQQIPFLSASALLSASTLSSKPEPDMQQTILSPLILAGTAALAQTDRVCARKALSS